MLAMSIVDGWQSKCFYRVALYATLLLFLLDFNLSKYEETLCRGCEGDASTSALYSTVSLYVSCSTMHSYSLYREVES